MSELKQNLEQTQKKLIGQITTETTTNTKQTQHNK